MLFQHRNAGQWDVGIFERPLHQLPEHYLLIQFGGFKCARFRLLRANRDSVEKTGVKLCGSKRVKHFPGADLFNPLAGLS